MHQNKSCLVWRESFSIHESFSRTIPCRTVHCYLISYRKMAAKQKHVQRVKQRILEKLKSLDEQEQAHFAVLHEHIAKVGVVLYGI